MRCKNISSSRHSNARIEAVRSELVEEIVEIPIRIALKGSASAHLVRRNRAGIRRTGKTAGGKAL